MADAASMWSTVMAGVGSSVSNSHYNPDEPRDQLGRWTTGGSSGKTLSTRARQSQDWPLPNPSPVGRARTLLGRGIVGLYPAFTLPSDKESKAFCQLLKAWNDADHLDDQTFHDLFVGDKLASPATTRLMREAAQGAKCAETIDQMIAASHPLTQAIKAIGPDCWPDTLHKLQGQAEAVVNGGVSQNSNEARTWAFPIIDPYVENFITTPDESLDKIAKEVNPSHGTENCADIVDAVIARLKGIDKNAVAKNGHGGKLNQYEQKYRTHIQAPVTFGSSLFHVGSLSSSFPATR
jgi:hypothetical protein